MGLGEIFYDFFGEILDNMFVEKQFNDCCQNINDHFHVFLYSGAHREKAFVLYSCVRAVFLVLWGGFLL